MLQLRVTWKYKRHFVIIRLNWRKAFNFMADIYKFGEILNWVPQEGLKKRPRQNNKTAANVLFIL
jgi:hypothetical protein